MCFPRRPSPGTRRFRFSPTQASAGALKSAELYDLAVRRANIGRGAAVWLRPFVIGWGDHIYLVVNPAPLIRSGPRWSGPHARQRPPLSPAPPVRYASATENAQSSRFKKYPPFPPRRRRSEKRDCHAAGTASTRGMDPPACGNGRPGPACGRRPLHGHRAGRERRPRQKEDFPVAVRLVFRRADAKGETRRAGTSLPCVWSSATSR